MDHRLDIKNSSGLILIGATGDKKLRAFIQKTGQVLWNYKLPGMARQFRVFMQPTTNNGFKGGYITFTVK